MRPNILLVIIDSLRASNLSCYGYNRKTTPNIDSIARQGCLYEQAISVGCWTLPVHASLFTGLFPINHGLTVSKDALPINFPTLPRQLREFGYQSASFSNNAYISDMTGLAQDFDCVEDIWIQSNPRGIRRTRMWQLIKFLERFGKRAEPIIRLVRMLQKTRAAMKRTKKVGDKGADLTYQKFEEWFNESRDPNKPFFVFVNFMEPHEPYNPPYPYDRFFMPEKYSRFRVAQVGNSKDVISRISEKRGQEDIEILTALYDGEIRYLDEKIGGLTKLLDSKGILDDTLLIITSDHGDSLGEHNHIGHRMALYEQLVHVPLILRYPKRFKPGTRISHQVSLMDLYPTMLELAGGEISNDTAKEISSLFNPQDISVRQFVIAENTAPKSLDSVVSRMVRSKRYKYIWKSNQEHELYDLEKDPDELFNLIGTEIQVAHEMRQYLERWENSFGDRRVTVEEAVYDDAVLERLRALGYVD